MHSIFAKYCGGRTYIQYRSDRNLKDLLELLEKSVEHSWPVSAGQLDNHIIIIKLKNLKVDIVI